MDCEIIDLGCMDYGEALDLQKKLHKQRQLDQRPDTLLLLEHPAVITYGRVADEEKNIRVDTEYLAQKNIQTVETDRGGDVTIHMPGQLIAYPIFDLKQYGRDIHKFVRALEAVMLQFLVGYGLVSGRRVKNSPGVWLGDKKIGFVGIGISKWISFHGISININCDLSFFAMICSCGIENLQITSLEQMLGKEMSMLAAKDYLSEAFKNIFNLQYRLEKKTI
ncbi:MAG: lipoyl(octanoyl) transferase LipB [PVC group bacterium]|nr:lipoyl(octanoyl) transferase LipB [PVC group bacterium]